MVPTIRDQLQDRPFLQRRNRRWCLWWSLGPFDQRDGRCQRLRGMGMFALAIRLVERIHLTGSLIFQRWIFILEGIATVIVAVASFWMLYDYPDTAKFLTEDERAFIVERLKLDNDGCSQAYKNKFIKDAFLDWKVWVVSRDEDQRNL
jgi:hypothetical protein